MKTMMRKRFSAMLNIFDLVGCGSDSKRTLGSLRKKNQIPDQNGD